MPDRPAGAELLAEARRTILSEIAPHLSGMPRFQALMVANALSIVRRELAPGDDIGRAERAALDLIGADSQALVEAIRSGRFDRDPTCHLALLRAAAARVAVWKPELLPDERTRPAEP